MTCTYPTISHAATHNARVLDKPAISRRLRKLGILISEIPSPMRDAVRIWATSLNETEVEAIAETARAIEEHERELAGENEGAE